MLMPSTINFLCVLRERVAPFRNQSSANYIRHGIPFSATPVQKRQFIIYHDSLGLGETHKDKRATHPTENAWKDWNLEGVDCLDLICPKRLSFQDKMQTALRSIVGIVDCNINGEE